MHKSFKTEVASSKTKRRTTHKLRRFVFDFVDKALRNEYGANYSIRCFQGSMAIQACLEFLGIKSAIWSGAVCMTKVTIADNQPKFGWSGFWGEDTHVWNFTEFSETVDLTISHLHLHPRSSTLDLPIPPIWWDDMSRVPGIMMYLSNAQPVQDFSSEETLETEKFIRAFREKLARRCEKPIDIGYKGAILFGPESLQQLMVEQHPWVSISRLAQDAPKPPWVQQKMDEKMQEWQQKNS